MLASMILIFAAVSAPAQDASVSQSDIQFEHGVELQQLGDLQGARKAYEASLKLTPRRLEAISNLGVVYALLDQYEQAVKYYKLALEIDPTHYGVRLNLGIAYFKTQEFESARRELAQVIAAQPDNLQARLLIGLCLLEVGIAKEAITELEAVYQAQPENVAAAYALGSAYISDNQLEKGGKVVDKIFNHLDLARMHLIMGSLNLAAKDYKKAIEELTQATRLSPRLPTAHSQLGSAYLINGNRDLAIQEFLEELKTNPRDFNANLRLGWLYREDGKLEKAAPLLWRALDLRPKDTGALFQMAQLAHAQGSEGDAVSLLERVVIQSPNFTTAHILLARLYFKLKRAGEAWAILGLCDYQLGRYDDALTHIRKGRQLGIGNNSEISRVLRYHEGTLLLLKGKFEAAQQTLSSLSYEGLKTEDLIVALGLSVLHISTLPEQIDANSFDRELLHRAGAAEYQFAQQNVEYAQHEYERLAADFPKTPNVHYAYGRFLLALRSDDAALTAFQHEIENSPDHALARIQIAYIKLKNKNPASGIPYAKQAIQLCPNLLIGHYLLGRLLYETGENTGAIKELETAQRLAPDEPKIYDALWRAYAQADQRMDAERARGNFVRLSHLAKSNHGTDLIDAIPENLPAMPPPAAPRND